MAQEVLRAMLKAHRNSRRPQQLTLVEEFVNGRLDTKGMKLPSLEKLTDRDLDLLVAAIDNC